MYVFPYKCFIISYEGFVSKIPSKSVHIMENTDQIKVLIFGILRSGN